MATSRKFLLLGGLVPDPCFCSIADHRHVGPTDVDVPVDLEIQGGSVNASRLERALKEAGVGPETARVWRWRDKGAPAWWSLEFLVDLDDVANQQVVAFDDCESLGAVNLRGTGCASQDWEVRTIAADLDGQKTTVSLRVATLPAYLLAKVNAAHGRALTKDWYDVAYVLLHNDDGGPIAAARRVRELFGAALGGSTETAPLGELAANFVDATAQGCDAYATVMSGLHTELDSDVRVNDAVSAAIAFVTELLIEGR